MSIVRRLNLLILSVALIASGFAGCETTSNNDQGTSFRATGFYDTGDGTVGDSGTFVAIFEDIPGSQGVFPLIVPVDKNPEIVGIQGGFFGAENWITSQFIRVVRVDCDHDVPGASIAIPSDAFAVTTVIPAAMASTGGVTVTIEPGRAFFQVEIVSPDVMQFLNVNRSSFPELPFRMVSTCSATGVTQAGDTLTTNPIFYTIQFADSPEPGAATFVGAGTGGNNNTIIGDPETTTGGTTTTSSALTQTDNGFESDFDSNAVSEEQFIIE